MSKSKSKVIKFPSGKRARSRQEQKAIAAWYVLQEKQGRSNVTRMPAPKPPPQKPYRGPVNIHGKRLKDAATLPQKHAPKDAQRLEAEFMRAAQKILGDVAVSTKPVRLESLSKGNVVRVSFPLTQSRRKHAAEAAVKARRRARGDDLISIPEAKDIPKTDDSAFYHPAYNSGKGGVVQGKKRQTKSGQKYLRSKHQYKKRVVYAVRILTEEEKRAGWRGKR